MERIHVLFPIETIVRELDYRLVLAAMHAHRGNRIFIGQTLHTYRLAEQSERGIYLGKHIFSDFPPYDRPIYHRAKDRGFKVIHLSEEGAVFQGQQDEWRSDLGMQFDPRVLAEDDYLCTWGDFQREHYRSLQPRSPEHVRTTGHPRFDLYKPEFRSLFLEPAQRIRDRFGKFVLINTNFAFVVNPLGVRNTFSPAWWYYPEDPIARMRHVARWSRVARTMPAFVELVHECSLKWPDVNFVVRPHPSDDFAYFEAVFAGVGNIHVLREGAVTPWLMACQLMIHDGCTTGIEAHLLGRPIVNYKPVVGHENEFYLPNVFGTRCESKDEAVRVIGEFLAQPLLPDVAAGTAVLDDVPSLAQDLLNNLRNEGFPLMLATLREAERALTGRPSGPRRLRVETDEKIQDLIDLGKAPVRYLSSRRRQSMVDAYARFPGFSRAAILRRMDLIRRILRKSVDVRVHSRRLIEVTSSEPAPAA